MRLIPKAALVAALVLLAPAVQAAQTQPPSFLAGVGAEPLSAKEMEAVRGEGLPAPVVKFALKQVKKMIGNAAAAKLAGLLEAGRVPSYKEYKAAFGSKTAAVLNVLPLLLKPKIAS